MKLKHTKMATLAATLIAFGSLAGGADGVTLYSSGVSSNTSVPVGSRGSSPSPDVVQTVATTFALNSESLLTSFTAEAAYIGSEAPGPTAPDDDVFTVALYADGGGATPGALIGSPITLNSFFRTDTGVDFDGYDIYSFDLILPSAVNLDAGNYWISIIGSTPGDPDYRWSWFFSSTDEANDPRYASNVTDQLGDYTYTANRSMIFTVEGSVVPEPTSSLLFGLGAFGFTVRRRRATKSNK